MSGHTTLHIPAATEAKIRQYLALLDATETRELSPEERIDAIRQMQQASRELFVQALFTVNHHRRNAP
ncbi:MAG: hypothetical protein WDA10_08855 [Porticoccaceae bacterium]